MAILLEILVMKTSEKAFVSKNHVFSASTLERDAVRVCFSSIIDYLL